MITGRWRIPEEDRGMSRSESPAARSITGTCSRVGLAGGAGLLLSGCDKARCQSATASRKILFKGEDIQRGLQRALTRPRDALAR